MDKDLPITNWVKEVIPNTSPKGENYSLYYRIHIQYIREENPERISPSSFKDHGLGMSTNWSKYSNASETQKGDGKKPRKDFCVVSLIIRSIRENNVINFKIVHDPLQKTNKFLGNRAHTNVFGLLDNERRYQIKEAQIFLSRIATWEINNFF